MIQPDSNRHDSDEKKHDGESSRAWLALLVIILLAGVVGWFWLARDPESREKLAQRFQNLDSITETVTSTLQDMASSLHGFATKARDSFIGQPPAPEIGATSGSALPGAPPKTLAPIETPEDLEKALAQQGPPQEGGASERGVLNPEDQTVPPDAGRKDDAVVRTDFIDDLASWLVKGYTPTTQGQSAQMTASLQSANLRYGMGMKGLAWIGEDLTAGRAAALNYVYTPAMLDALYRLYINRFMESVNRTLDAPSTGEKTLSRTQKTDFYTSYARRFRSLSGALQGVAALPDFTRQMDELKRTAQRVIDANAQYSELVFASDEAREQGNIARAETLRQRMDSASHVYRQAVIDREKSREAFAQLVRKNPTTRDIDSESILYIASWVERRVRNAPDRMEATFQAATLFLNLAQQFETAEQTIQNGGVPAASTLPTLNTEPAPQATPPYSPTNPATLPNQVAPGVPGVPSAPIAQPTFSAPTASPVASPAQTHSLPAQQRPTPQADEHVVRQPITPMPPR